MNLGVRILKYLQYVILTLAIMPSHAEEAAVCLECETKDSAPIVAPAIVEVAKAAEKSFNDIWLLNPEFVETTDSRKLGELIVKRLHERCEKIRDPSETKASKDMGEIVMLVPEQYIESISKTGFKNQHQTSVTGGSNCKSCRIGAESQHVLLGLPYSNKSRELLPKYAMFVFNDNKHGSFFPPFSYGRVVIHFKPEVKKRATWSYNDSLGDSQPLRTHSTRPSKNGQCSGYCESQIWGELDFTDVKSITVPEGTAITQAMKDIGVPIYTYSQKTEEKPETSLLGISFNKIPVFKPKKDQSPKARLSRSIEEIQSELEKIGPSGNQAQKNILESEKLAKSSTGDLLKDYFTDTSVTPPVGITYGADDLGTKKGRILAELSAREKSDVTKELFKNILENSVSPAPYRALALTGLAGLPWSDLKPLLIKQIESYVGSPYSQPKHLSNIVLAIALEHSGDEDVKKAIENSPALKPTFQNLAESKFCTKESYE